MPDRHALHRTTLRTTATGSAKQAVLTGLAIAVPLIVLSVAAVWWLSRPSSTVRIDSAGIESDPSSEASAAEQALPALTRARRALERGRIVSPAGDNAFEIYLGIAPDSPDHLGATQALLELVPLAVREAESDIANGQLDEAERIRRLIARADPASLAVVNLEREIARARAARTAAPVEPRPNEPAIAPAPGPTLASAPAPRPLEAGGPTAAVPAASPSPSTIAPSTLAQAAPMRAAERANSTDDAPDTAVANQERRDEPSTSSAPADSAPAPTAVRASTLINPVPLNDVAPRYPVQAMRMRQEGSVVLEFVIQVDGSVRDVRIVQSNPPQVFDREALRTAMRWRFEPRQLDGRPVEARARRTINFRLGS